MTTAYLDTVTSRNQPGVLDSRFPTVRMKDRRPVTVRLVRHILLRWLAPTYLVSEILSELHDFRSAPGIHPVLRERGGSVGLATADRDLVLLETGETWTSSPAMMARR
jgi:hypothetical protein